MHYCCAPMHVGIEENAKSEYCGSTKCLEITFVWVLTNAGCSSHCKHFTLCTLIANGFTTKHQLPRFSIKFNCDDRKRIIIVFLDCFVDISLQIVLQVWTNKMNKLITLVFVPIQKCVLICIAVVSAMTLLNACWFVCSSSLPIPKR